MGIRTYKQNEISVGDVVGFYDRAHPTMGQAVEVIGRVGKDARGLYAGTRYLPMDGIVKYVAVGD